MKIAELFCSAEQQKRMFVWTLFLMHHKSERELENKNWKFPNPKKQHFFDYETTLVHMHNDAQNLKEQQQKLFFFWKKSCKSIFKGSSPSKSTLWENTITYLVERIALGWFVR